MSECRTEGIELTPEEVERLTELPDAAHEVKGHLLCELEDGHAGPHWTLAQTQDRGYDDQITWWLKWSASSREWMHDPFCSFESGDEELCVLPAGHEGVHAFA